MVKRPAIPKPVQQQLLFEVRHRCAVDCEPVSLEKAHIVAWSKSKDHSPANLIVLCANCHTRSHVEKWTVAMLQKYKQHPCALQQQQMPPMSAEQKALVDMIIAVPPDNMSNQERLRLASIVAAYAGVQFSTVSIISVAPTNSSRIRLELPKTGKDRLLSGFQARDPRLFEFFNELGAGVLLRVEDAKFQEPVFAAVTDISEKGLEGIIVTSMTGRPWPNAPAEGEGTGWLHGVPQDFDREWCVDLAHLTAFVSATQPKMVGALDLAKDSPARRQFLSRLSSEVSKRGVVDVLRNGVKHGPHEITLFGATPSLGNARAITLNAQNRFSVIRQLRYSRDETMRSLDLGLFINGLPVATFELKNSLTKQTVADAIEQYKRDRDPREPLFAFGRCVVHLAVDDSEVRMCTELAGKGSWFLPLNKGWNDGAGNPPNPHGVKTDYLWKDLLTPRGLTNILENYAQIVEETNRKTGRKKKRQVFPRYHQLDVVRKLLADAEINGAGKRYLIEHSAGSGKSNSIAWLAHQLTGIEKDSKPTFDSIIVITDRVILDRQIRDTIKQFSQVRATMGHAERSGDLRKFIESGKKIIISTVQKFPFIIDEISDAHRGRSFAIIIDEAHSSQGGKTAAAMSEALSDPEDTINDALEKRMQARKMLTNASYFAFTATPKNKTLEIFGSPEPTVDGKTAHRPFHSYTMKQAIQEGFILDVLKNYTPVASYYKLIKTVEADPEFDTKRAKKKLRRYVESHDHAIRLKAEIMVDHFQEQVIGLRKIEGEARAMVVTSGIERAIQYFYAIREYLKERKSPYSAIVAFSGEYEYGGKHVTESAINGFPSSEIPDQIQEAPYRFLICADKFQTGYDEPLLHTMYVDKHLAGVKAVQTLSRLNRAHPKKHDVFVLDFMNDAETIQESFAPYYRTTILSEETDPNKLHDLKAALDGYQVYGNEQRDQLVSLYLEGAGRDQLDPNLDVCVARYLELDEDGQVDFKGKAKAFVRSYEFLASILPYTNADWEKLSIYLNMLVPKLPAPKEEDLTKGILETIDMDSYRAEKKATMALRLSDQDIEIGPVPVEGGGNRNQPELDRLSNILNTFNDQFGTLFTDGDRIIKRIRDDVAPKVAADEAFQNAKRNTPGAAKIEHDKALTRVMLEFLKDDTEVYKQFVQNESFRRFITDMVYQVAGK
jgi:type I restriction enzyme R subunit